MTSYTQTKEWTIYGVNRGRGKGAAEVEGVQNVYDDQMWLIRELIESYRLTGEQKYLEKAEYLTSYVLDGWDCTLDETEYRTEELPGDLDTLLSTHAAMDRLSVRWYGFTNFTKANPMKLLTDMLPKIIAESSVWKRSQTYYLNFAKAVYDYQKEHLMNPAIGVYDDMMGGCDSPDIKYVEISGNKYLLITQNYAIG